MESFFGLLYHFFGREISEKRSLHNVRILDRAPYSIYLEDTKMDLGKLKEATAQALVLAFYDAGNFLTTAPSTFTASWSVTGAGASIVPSTDGSSAVVTPTSTGTITVSVSVSGTNTDGSAFSATSSSTLEVVSGIAVSVQIQLAPVVPAPAPVAPAAA